MNYKQIIQRELEIWMSAYPSQGRLLKKFADKIKLELSLQCKELNSDFALIKKVAENWIV